MCPFAFQCCFAERGPDGTVVFIYRLTHTLILKHGRAINSVAAALICSLRGDCIRTMPSSGCSREEREEREEKGKTTNHHRHPAGVEVETEILLLTDENTAETRRAGASYSTSRPPDDTDTPEASTSSSLRPSCRWSCNMSSVTASTSQTQTHDSSGLLSTDTHHASFSVGPKWWINYQSWVLKLNTLCLSHTEART